MRFVSTHSRLARRLSFAALTMAVGAVLATGCKDPYAPSWPYAIVDTVTLYSLARPDLNLPNAFSFHLRHSYEVEDPTATGSWDVAVDTRGGEIVLLPPGALNVPTGAGIAVMPGVAFDEVTEAPKDTMAYSTQDPVPAQTGNVYVIRSGQTVGIYGTYCRYYSKMEPINVDAADGTLRFIFDSNPICNSRSLIPTG